MEGLKTMLDGYTKLVLTVIAVALTALAVGQFRPERAVAQGAGCGDIFNPCFITTTVGLLGLPETTANIQGNDVRGLPVIVLNQPF